VHEFDGRGGTKLLAGELYRIHHVAALAHDLPEDGVSGFVFEQHHVHSDRPRLTAILQQAGKQGAWPREGFLDAFETAVGDLDHHNVLARRIAFGGHAAFPVVEQPLDRFVSALFPDDEGQKAGDPGQDELSAPLHLFKASLHGSSLPDFV